VREVAPDVTTAKSGRTDTSLSVLLSEEASLTAHIPDGARCSLSRIAHAVSAGSMQPCHAGQSATVGRRRSVILSAAIGRLGSLRGLRGCPAPSPNRQRPGSLRESQCESGQAADGPGAGCTQASARGPPAHEARKGTRAPSRPLCNSRITTGRSDVPAPRSRSGAVQTFWVSRAVSSARSLRFARRIAAAIIGAATDPNPEARRGCAASSVSRPPRVATCRSYPSETGPARSA